MAATVAGRVALGFGVTPNVSPRCTGAVDAFTRLFCAGMAAAARAALGCGARMICGLAALMVGRLTFASSCTGFGSGFSFGISILGASSFTCGGLGISFIGGGGGILTLIGGGGGVVGKISSVCSYLCS